LTKPIIKYKIENVKYFVFAEVAEWSINPLGGLIKFDHPASWDGEHSDGLGTKPLI